MKFVVTVCVQLSLQVDADSVREAYFRAEKASNLMFDAANHVWYKDAKPIRYPAWFQGYRTQGLFHKAKSERGTLDLYTLDRIKADNERLIRRSSPGNVTIESQPAQKA
jgi:hypothetical protein